jgi:hypothetical protein
MGAAEATARERSVTVRTSLGGQFCEDGLVSASTGHYDQAEYDRQLEQGASA